MRRNYSDLTNKNDINDVGLLNQQEPINPVPTQPERVFKVVFVGDSGVGKSSFIHRLCHDQWKPSFTATIGQYASGLVGS